jgi:hypothetical protein
MIWPDSRISFIVVYYVAAWCGYFSQPALASLSQDPYDRFPRQRGSSNVFGSSVAASLVKKFFVVEDFCDKKKEILLMGSCASLVLTALACRWTWWWFHGSNVSLMDALMSLSCVELAGFLLGLGLHQWLLTVLSKRTAGSANSGQATSQMEAGTLRIVPPGESPPASPTTNGRRIV